jgi:predicted ATP-grasp superfamily ATP-dependent carboligase
MHLFKHSPIPSAEISARLKLPVFVKPNNGGSSIGMSKVTKPEDLQTALDKAFREDDQVLVEEFISGREFTYWSIPQRWNDHSHFLSLRSSQRMNSLIMKLNMKESPERSHQLNAMKLPLRK